MNKINLLNLILFVFVIILASTIYLSEQTSSLLDTLTTTQTDSISSIRILHNNSTTQLEKQLKLTQGSQWKITQPVTVNANDFRVNSILKMLNAPVHSHYELSEFIAADIGLSNPPTRIQFNDLLIKFGITNQATNLRYVQINNDVYTIEDVYYPLLSSHFGTLASLNLIPENSKIKKLILGNQTITKDSNGFWQSNLNISADAINTIIDYWKTLQAFGVHEYMPRKESTEEVFIYIEGQKEPVTFVVTDTEPWLIIARPELKLEYHLDIEAYKKLISPE